MVLHDLKVFKQPNKMTVYFKLLRGIKHTLQQEAKQASPFTVDMLKKIEPFVNQNDSKEVTTWTATLFGFFYFSEKLI